MRGLIGAAGCWWCSLRHSQGTCALIRLDPSIIPARERRPALGSAGVPCHILRRMIHPLRCGAGLCTGFGSAAHTLHGTARHGARSLAR